MKKFTLTILIILFSFLSVNAQDPVILNDEIYSDITLYIKPTDKNITIGWDSTNDPIKYPEIFYDFFLWNRGEETKYLLGRTQLLQVTIIIPRTGLWIFYAKACDKEHTNDTRKCSNWSHSALVGSDGIPFGQVKDPANPGSYIPGRWMIYSHIAAPTSGGIE